MTSVHPAFLANAATTWRTERRLGERGDDDNPQREKLIEAAFYDIEAFIPEVGAG